MNGWPDVWMLSAKLFLVSPVHPVAQLETPFYEEWWFLIILALSGLILLLIVVFGLLFHGQSRRYKSCGTGENTGCGNTVWSRNAANVNRHSPSALIALYPCRWRVNIPLIYIIHIYSYSFFYLIGSNARTAMHINCMVTPSHTFTLTFSHTFTPSLLYTLIHSLSHTHTPLHPLSLSLAHFLVNPTMFGWAHALCGSSLHPAQLLMCPQVC